MIVVSLANAEILADVDLRSVPRASHVQTITRVFEALTTLALSWDTLPEGDRNVLRYIVHEGLAPKRGKLKRALLAWKDPEAYAKYVHALTTFIDIASSAVEREHPDYENGLRNAIESVVLDGDEISPHEIGDWVKSLSDQAT